MDIFNECHKVNDLLLDGDEENARNELIKLLNYHGDKKIVYSPLVNHLIRQVGLFPYIDEKTAIWEDRFVYEAFKVNTGRGHKQTLHREQSHVLKQILEGKNIAVTAPTSFGKSFIIDAFIAIKEPKNVVIIVPTIALTDETRRRIYKKFSDEYKIITTLDVELSQKNILIFPQERALSYVDKIESIDLLIIDEFYKASIDFDKERAPSLVKALIQLGDKSEQKYYLAPNISSINQSPLTDDMVPCDKLDFNTVYLEKVNWYKEIGKDEVKKSSALIEILSDKNSKTLIYAGTYNEIDKVGQIILNNIQVDTTPLLDSFVNWLSLNYSSNWNLLPLIERKTGIHTGGLHRSLAQIEVKLFEDMNGLKSLISTSSIIEGVNTSAKNIVVWKTRAKGHSFSGFSYKNLIGRGGRMFRYFIGKIYILAPPPPEKDEQLDIQFPDTLAMDITGTKIETSISLEKVRRINEFKDEMNEIVGGEFEKMFRENLFQTTDFQLLKKIANSLKNEPDIWNGLGHLNSKDPKKWKNSLHKALEIKNVSEGANYTNYVKFVMILSNNWKSSIPELLEKLATISIGIDQFFRLERSVCFKLSALLSDINILQKTILKTPSDISSFVGLTSCAFLPRVVYQLEEYGLPRMLSKKLQKNFIFNFEDTELKLHSVLDSFKQHEKRIRSEDYWDSFDRYILDHFYDGITLIPLKE